MKPFIVVCITIISILFTNRIKSQDIHFVFSEGEHWLNVGNTSEAKEALLRVVFFDSAGVYQPKAYNMLGDLAVKEDDLVKAQTYYDYAYSLEEIQQIKNDILGKKVLLYLKEYEFQLAASSAELMDPVQSDMCNSNIKLLAKGTNALNKADFEMAEIVYLKLAKDRNDSIAILNAFQKVNIKSRNIKKARILSAVIPGLGQLYQKDFKNSIKSFLLVGGLTFLVINTGIIYGPVSTIISVVPWWARYYRGGIKKNEVIFNKNLNKQKQEIYTNVVNYLVFKNYICD